MQKGIFLLVIIILTGAIYSSWFDTGYKTWKQPDGTEFTARHWGDEFFNWFETDDGYTIKQNSEGWYTYAKLDNKGDFRSSNKIVGKHKPTGFVKQLKRSQERTDYLNDKIERITEKRHKLYLSHLDGNGLKKTTSGVKTLGIVLIDFEPQSQKEGHKRTFYERIFFSQGFYYDDDKRPNDNDEVFGSLNDYIIDQTASNWSVSGNILNGNDSTDSEYPEWFEIKQSKDWYLVTDETERLDTVFSQLEAEFGLQTLRSYNAICLVIAGESSESFSADMVTLSDGEDISMFTIDEYDGGKLVHMGSIAHEFLHAGFGFQDQYRGNVSPGPWAIMGNGNDNGPTGAAGSCPAPINPVYKMEMGWKNATTIAKNSYNYEIQLNQYYKVEMYGESYQFFILEAYDGSETYTQHTPNFDKAKERGLHIWICQTYSILDNCDIVGSPKFSGGTTLDDYSGTRLNKYTYSTPYGNVTGTEISDIKLGNISVILSDPPPPPPLVEHEWTIAGDVIDPLPKSPAGFAIMGGNGEHPTIAWNKNNEPDIAGYKIYRNVDGPFSLVKNITNPSQVSWIDADVTLGFPLQHTACYKMLAYDAASNNSDYSNDICKAASDFQIEKNSNIRYMKDVSITSFHMEEAYPNPFNPSTFINYQLPGDGHVSLKIYDITGREILQLVDDNQVQGSYSVKFNADGLSSGIYIAVLNFKNSSFSKKIILAK